MSPKPAETRDPRRRNGTAPVTSAAASAAETVPARIRSKRWIAAVAFAVTLAVVGVAVVMSSERTFDAAGAQATVDRYFAAYNDGDDERVTALLAPDATFDWTYAGTGYDRSAWEIRMAWFLGQGASLVDKDCAVEPAGVDDFTVVCDYGTHFSTTSAIGQAPVPTWTTFRVGPKGIVHFGEETLEPDYLFTNEPFLRWMQTHFPEESEAADFDDFASVEEARRHGDLRARYAARWADAIEAGGCEWRFPGCAPVPLSG